MKIAICGKMCSGKTTLANYIIDTFPGYQRYSFAHKVKELCVELFQMKTKNRPLLINFANKMRDIDPDVWVNQVLQQTRGKTHCVIDDVRYQNEADALIQDGWTFIQLTVPRDIQIQRITQLYPLDYQDHINASDHISEQNSFIFPEGYPQLQFTTLDDKQEQIKQEVTKYITTQV
tara:strand:- start:219 stop:746 length:528 start_codon:yes stop_codon:yes gene_type:complete